MTNDTTKAPHCRVSRERLMALLDYDALTGAFVWKVQRGTKRRVGDVAGSPDPTASGRIRIGIDGRNYYAHQLAWLHFHGQWPHLVIDHIDGNAGNNAISNLRCVTQKLNSRNRRRPHPRSSTQVLGVSTASHSTWRARIKVDGKDVLLGYFSSQSDASAAYVAAKRIHHPEAWLGTNPLRLPGEEA